MSDFDLSYLSRTETGMYMGRSYEVWAELGLSDLLTRAQCGELKAMRECSESVKRSRI